jgi:hypothetical protein
MSDLIFEELLFRNFVHFLFKKSVRGMDTLYKES